MEDIHYLFFGIGAEYVLNPLYRHMQDKGFKCSEIELLTSRDAKSTLKSLKGKPVVFLTSAHLFLDQHNMSFIQKHEIDIISPLEIMDYLKPIKSFLMPHDLTSLFHDQDMPWVDLFDYLLIPFPCPLNLLSHPNVINVGWIKRSNAIQPVKEEGPHTIGFALSDFTCHISLGVQKSYEIWKPILDHGVTIKFPQWEKDREFEDYFIAQGVNIFRSTLAISDFIDMHSIIICNSLSSVNSEAALAGRKSINILHPDTAVLQQTKLGKLPNIQFMTIDECANYIYLMKNKSTRLDLTPPQLTPFNFDLATQVILQ